MKYAQRTPTVDAWQWIPEVVTEGVPYLGLPPGAPPWFVEEWNEGRVQVHYLPNSRREHERVLRLLLISSERVAMAKPFDWIIRRANGSLASIYSDTFHRDYEPQAPAQEAPLVR